MGDDGPEDVVRGRVGVRRGDGGRRRRGQEGRGGLEGLGGQIDGRLGVLRPLLGGCRLVFFGGRGGWVKGLLVLFVRVEGEGERGLGGSMIWVWTQGRLLGYKYIYIFIYMCVWPCPMFLSRVHAGRQVPTPTHTYRDDPPVVRPEGEHLAAAPCDGQARQPLHLRAGLAHHLEWGGGGGGEGGLSLMIDGHHLEWGGGRGEGLSLGID